MTNSFQNQLALLSRSENRSLLNGILRGLEKESLRTTADGTLALTPHPTDLGAALTHPQITTDFSEALLEFITPPSHQISTLLDHLGDIHRFTYQHIEDEMLWCNSMPCMMGKDEDIPVARYGSTNRGRMKTIYRVGLGHRYGRTMQTVAGVHFNFSIPSSIWALLHHNENSVQDLSEYKNQRYFDLIRNFRREYWLLIYLFGASPAICKSFVKGRPHRLEVFNNDSHSLHLPYATSLRMGDLGYQSSAQESLFVCYNALNTYVSTLIRAIQTPYAPYGEIGMQDERGEFKQLNTSLLQIENEFYSPIRPKRVAQQGETALTALCQRGVEYIEVRCLDIDPFDPLGISETQIRFLDMFLLHCALRESPACNAAEFKAISDNQKVVVNKGREPGLQLIKSAAGQQQAVALKTWGTDILTQMAPIAELLDTTYQCGSQYRDALAAQQQKLTDPEQTPSAKILADMQSQKLSYVQWAKKISHEHQSALVTKPLNDDMHKRFSDMAEESLAIQADAERENQQPFTEHLAAYYAQYDCTGKL